MQTWKNEIEKSLKNKREEDLKKLISELKKLPEILAFQNMESYQNQLASRFREQRNKYISTFQDSTPLPNFSEIPEHNIRNLISIWDIQRRINFDYLEMYDDEAQLAWYKIISKVQRNDRYGE